MLSRIAENLYWMGRYIERAENTARLLSVNYQALTEGPLVAGGASVTKEQWAPLLHILETEAAFRQHFDLADASSVPVWLSVHKENPASIRSSLSAARENARALRDRISTEMWEALNRSYLSLCIVDRPPEEDALHDYCVSAREASHLFFGIADATLPRDGGWYFLKAGQYLERADAGLRTLLVSYRKGQDATPVSRGVEAHQRMALLKSLSAYEAYRKRYQTTLEPGRMADFLLLDPYFPRSVRFCAQVLSDILHEIAQQNQGVSQEPVRQADWLAARLAYLSHAQEIVQEEGLSLHSFLDALFDLSNAVSDTYFRRGQSVQMQLQSGA